MLKINKIRIANLVLYIITSFLLGLIFISILYNLFIIKNISDSVALGYYIKLPIIRHIQVNQVYSICINNQVAINELKQLDIPQVSNGICRSNIVPLLKRVIAKNGDTILITKDGILINNKLIPNILTIKNSKIKLTKIPIGTKFNLKKDEYWVMGDTPNSYDSRYFGIVSESEFINKALKLF